MSAAGVTDAIRKRKISDREEVVEEGDFKGLCLCNDPATGAVVALSSRYAADEDRWETGMMPSLHPYSSTLEALDLSKNRYITEVHQSVTALPKLTSLSLTACTSLEALPSSIGRLNGLKEVFLDCHLLFCITS